MKRVVIILIALVAVLLVAGAITVRLTSEDRADGEIARFDLPPGDIDKVFTVKVAPSIKELRIVLADGGGRLRLADYRFVITGPDGQQQYEGSGGMSLSGRNFLRMPKPIEDEKAKFAVEDGGELVLKFKAKVGGQATQLIVRGVEEAGYRPVESLDDASRRLKANPDDRAAQQLVRAVLRDPRLDEPSVRKLLGQLGEMPTLACRPVYKVNAPAIIELRGGQKLLDGYGRLWARVGHEWGIEIDGAPVCRMGQFRAGSGGSWSTRANLGMLIGKQAGEHRLRFYFLATWTSQGQERTCKLIGPETEVRVVEKLPDGYLRAVTNDQLDANVRACFDLNFNPINWDRGDNWLRRSSSLGCPLSIVKPLPIALGHDIFVSVNGSEPRLFDSYLGDGRWFQSRASGTAAGAGQTQTRIKRGFLGISGSQPEFGKPGTYSVRFILRPSEDAALTNIDSREYWGGTYESPSYEFEYVTD